jgi:hypothetical protein
MITDYVNAEDITAGMMISVKRGSKHVTKTVAEDPAPIGGDYSNGVRVVYTDGFSEEYRAESLALRVLVR